MEVNMTDNGKETVPVKKPAKKKKVVVKRKVFKVPLEKISEIRFTKDGEEFFLVPHRPHGAYILQRVPK
jgi:hypothetical protein